GRVKPGTARVVGYSPTTPARVVSWLDCPCLPPAVWARPRLRLSPVAAPRLGEFAVLRHRPLDLDPRPNGGREARAIEQTGHYRQTAHAPPLRPSGRISIRRSSSACSSAARWRMR